MSLHRKAPPVSVWTRATWADEWTGRSDLVCRSMDFAASPTMPEAVLEWKYGIGAQPGNAGERQTCAPLDIVGHYVKIQIDPDAEFETGGVLPWYGRIVEVSDDRGGDLGVYHARTGVQSFIAWGMESELDDDKIVDSRTETEQGEQWIGRVLPFNLRDTPLSSVGSEIRDPNERRALDNRSINYGEKAAHVFSYSLDYADTWTALEVIEYLLVYHAPTDNDGKTPIPWKLDDSLGVSHLEAYRPKLDPEGKTIRELLNLLMERRRASGWYVRVDESTSPATCYIVPFVHASEAIVLPDGTRLEANPSQESLDFEADNKVLSATLRTTEASRYDQVIVRGARMGVVLTLSADGGRIDRDWTDADQTAYNEAATGETGYAGWDRREQQAANLAFRLGQNPESGDRIQRVFSWFRLAEDWDEAGEDENGDPGSWAALQQNPDVLGDRREDIRWDDDPSNLWLPGLRFGDHLPMFEGEDYTGQRVWLSEIRQGGADCEFMRPMVFAKDDEGNYFLTDKAGAAAGDEDAGENGRPWSASIRNRRDRAGFILKIAGGQQHVLGSDDFEPADDTDDFPAELNWKTDLVVTMYLPIDDHVDVRVPTDDEIADDPELAGRRVRRMIVSRPEFHLDYILPDTVVGCRAGVLERSDGGVLRSDRERMAKLARLAAQWYAADRKALSVEYRGLLRILDLGTLITEIGNGVNAEAVRTCVTRIHYDVQGGKTVLQTQYAELDLKVQ